MSQKPSGAPTMWQPTIPIDQSIYEASSTQKAPLGTRLEVGDRVFYYAQLSTSANITAGKIVCQGPMIASHQADILTPAATSAGEKVVTLTLGTAIAANEYAEGYMIISSGDNNNYTYHIKSNPAAATAATGATLVLYDELKSALTATNEINLVPNIYDNVKVGSEVLDMPVGVTPLAVTTGEYFWLQTYGPAGVYNSAALGAGVAVKMGTLGYAAAYRSGTEGGGATSIEVGKNYNLAGSAAEETPILLTIRP